MVTIRAVVMLLGMLKTQVKKNMLTMDELDQIHAKLYEAYSISVKAGGDR